MKQLLIILFIFVSIVATATNYTVGSDGDYTSWSGVPTLSAGDSVFFKRGETFTQAITIGQSGTSGNPIYIGAYGTGADPIISGFTSVTSWTDLGSNIWESTNAVSTLATCNMVVVDNVNTPAGRYPNGQNTWLNIDSYAGTTSITCATINGQDWTGGEVCVRTNQWDTQQQTISTHTTSTITFTSVNRIRTDYGFFIQNHSGTLDHQNEWYYNTSTKKLSIYSTSEPTNIKVPIVENLMYTGSSSYITVQNITFEGANTYGIYDNSTVTTGMAIDNCEFNFMGANAVYFDSFMYATITNNTINDCNSRGIHLFNTSDYATINNNTVSNTGIYYGAGIWDTNNSTAIYVQYNSDNTTINYNTITNTGYTGISISGNDATANYNVIDSFCTILQDGGGIYSWGRYTNRVLDHNIITNGIGNYSGTTSTSQNAHAIYIDEQGNNIEITNNTLAYTNGSGIYFHWCDSITTTDNIMYDCIANTYLEGVIGYDMQATNPTTAMVTKNNQIVTFDSGSYSISFNSETQGLSAFQSFGVQDSNYYIAPFNNDDIAKTKHYPGYVSTYYTLAEWQTFSSKDSHSLISPYTITSESDMQLVVNEETTSQAISLSGTWKDLDGTNYIGSITIEAFTSKILFVSDYVPTVQNLYIYKNATTGKYYPYGYYK